MLSVVSDTNVDEFLKSAGPLLYAQEAANSLMLGICLGLESSSVSNGTKLLRVTEAGNTYLAAIQTPPYNLIISFGNREHLASLANYLVSQKILIPGVVGPENEAKTFADIWTSLAGQRCKLGMDQRIYQLYRVNMPAAEGILKPGDTADLQVIGTWIYEFGQESLPEREKPTLEQSMDLARKSISSHSSFLWIRDNEPVSVAHLGRPTKNGISIRAVYTPAQFRKNGFGSAIVAHLSKKQLEDGKNFCVLYTDSANQTSNKIYQEIGYELVIHSKHIIFS